VKAKPLPCPILALVLLAASPACSARSNGSHGASAGNVSSGSAMGRSSGGAAGTMAREPASPGDAGEAGTEVDATMPDAGDATIPTYHGAADAGQSVLYASGYDPNIHVFSIDSVTGALGQTSSITSFGTSPSFLAVSPNGANLYAVDENEGGAVGAYTIDPATGALTFLNDVSSGGANPAYVSVDHTGKYVFVPNYDGGTVSVLPVLPGGKLGSALQTLTVGIYPHMTLIDPSNRFVLVPCKGSDYVAQFVFDAATGMLSPNAVAPTVATAVGAGPRHAAFHPSSKLVYLINETNSTLSAYGFDNTTGTLILPAIDTQSTIPAIGPDATGNTAAEVWVHPSGRWVLGSNRGDDSIVVFAIDATTGRMTWQQRMPAGGASPRDFTFDLTGSLVYAADQSSNYVVTFAFDSTLGMLSATTDMPALATAPAFVGVLRLPGH
jgi:6-phosphogluconolactonase